jgi:hypothetical protein
MQDPGVLWFMIKQREIGDQNDDHNRGELRRHPEGFLRRDLRRTPVGLRSFRGAAVSRSGKSRPGTKPAGVLLLSNGIPTIGAMGPGVVLLL